MHTVAEPITLQIALDDPAPLFAVKCRACDAKFEDINGKGLCDPCLVERINGAGELELDDPDDVINQPQPHICDDCGHAFLTALPERGRCVACIAKRLGIRQANITCRVHHLPAPSNAQGLLLCQDCLDNLDSAAAHIAELRETTSEAWADYLISLDAATFEWWEKMENLKKTNPKAWAGKATLASARGGRGAAVVQAWQAKEDALTRCDQAAHEIATAKETHHGAI